MSVSGWDAITQDLNKLRFLIEATFQDRTECEYDLSRPMRRANASPP